MAELKSCPFCGKEAIQLIDFDDYTGEIHVAIHCRQCKVRTKYYDSLDEAIKTWNRRATDDR